MLALVLHWYCIGIALPFVVLVHGIGDAQLLCQVHVVALHKIQVCGIFVFIIIIIRFIFIITIIIIIICELSAGSSEMLTYVYE